MPSRCAVLIFSVSACVQSCLSPLRAGRLDWSRVPRAFSHQSVWVCRRPPDNQNSHNVPCEWQMSPSLAPGAAARSHRSRSHFQSLHRQKTHTPANQFSSSHTSPRGTGPTFAQAANSTTRAPLRNHCLQTTCTVKDFYLYAVLSPLALSFYSCAKLPLLTLFLKICNMLDRSGSSGLSCFITWNLSRAAGLCLKEEWAAMVPSIISAWGVDIHCWNHLFFMLN